jgi:2-keto-4-pentenoate hydratase
MARQLERFRAALASGMPRRGWKIGINVPEVLRRLDLTHPGVGWIDGRRVFADGVELAARADARLHAEPELALAIARAVPPACDADLLSGSFTASAAPLTAGHEIAADFGPLGRVRTRIAA